MAKNNFRSSGKTFYNILEPGCRDLLQNSFVPSPENQPGGGGLGGWTGPQNV